MKFHGRVSSSVKAEVFEPSLNGPTALLREMKQNQNGIRKKRNRLEIISEMLEIAKNGSRKTTMMQDVNLSYQLLVDYLSLLLRSGLVEGDTNQRFFVTGKGLEFLREFGEFRTLQSRWLLKAERINSLIEEDLDTI